MNVHELKCYPRYFDAILDGSKTFEARRDDRGFEVGDQLRLREWEPTLERYTDREHLVEVTYVLRGGEFGIEDGYVVMSIWTAEPTP